MTQEEKDLIVKDLCARLPYGVICKASHGIGNTDKKHEYIGVLKFVGNCHGVIANYYEDLPHDTGLINNVFYDIKYIKPYLRPMSSMTEEEDEWLNDRINFSRDDEVDKVKQKWGIVMQEIYTNSSKYVFSNFTEILDWFNAHHFDYRGLIPTGLALEAPEGMYN